MSKETFERVENTYTLGTIGHIKDFEKEIKVQNKNSMRDFVNKKCNKRGKR